MCASIYLPYGHFELESIPDPYTQRYNFHHMTVRHHLIVYTTAQFHPYYEGKQ